MRAGGVSQCLGRIWKLRGHELELITVGFFFFATSHSLWGLSFLARDRTQALSSASAES